MSLDNSRYSGYLTSYQQLMLLDTTTVYGGYYLPCGAH